MAEIRLDYIRINDASAKTKPGIAFKSKTRSVTYVLDYKTVLP